MTNQDVQVWINKIVTIRSYGESAHIEEDIMRAAVLTAIANGEAADPAEMARLAMTSSTIDSLVALAREDKDKAVRLLLEGEV